MNRLIQLRQRRLAQLREMAPAALQQLLEAMRLDPHLAKLQYHFERHGEAMGATSPEDYCQRLQLHVARQDLRVFTALRPKDETKMWFLVAVDNGDVAQYNESQGRYWSFFSTEELQEVLAG